LTPAFVHDGTERERKKPCFRSATVATLLIRREPHHQAREPARALGGHRGHQPPAGRDVPPGRHHRIAERRNNRNIARVAAARKLLALVFYGLRDGEIRCLADAG
jgi:hypothetical protein